jgi:ribonuclease D
MLKLREWRNAEVSRQNLPAVAILSNQVLKSLVRVAPRTVEELSSVPDMRRWQIATSGEAVLEVIRAVIGAVPPEPKKKKRRKKPATRRKPEVSAPEAKRTEASGAD